MSISKDEISRYDRQIRLWGLDGQQKLSSCRVVVLGVRAIAIELLKNLVLAGVGSICLVDAGQVEDSDLGHNYFIRPDEIGMMRAAVTARRLGELNPRVSLGHDERALSELPLPFFEEFDVVIATEAPFAELVRINDHTHQRKIKFYATGLLGWGSYLFSDLVEHRYEAARPASNQAAALGSVSFTRTILDLRGEGENEVLVVEERYTSLRDAVRKAPEFAATLRKKQQRLVSPYLPGLLAHWETLSVSSADLEAKTAALGLPAEILNQEWCERFVGGLGVELAANASVLAGFLAQDVINCVTRKGHPIQNLFLYDSYQGKGAVYRLG